jgi:F0F1-type ATP synthase membrane subunit a
MGKLGIISIVAFLVLLTLRVSHAAIIGWGVITSPLWVYAGLAIIVMILFHVLKIEHHGPE